jgi:hypothetical protein
VLHVNVKDGDNEHNMAKDTADTMEEIFTAARWDVVSKTDKFYPPGYSIHEVGTARMGDDPKKERAEPVEPDARYQESAGDGRRLLCDLRVAKSHHDDFSGVHAGIGAWPKR